MPKEKYEKLKANWEAKVKRVTAANLADRLRYGACADTKNVGQMCRPISQAALPGELNLRPAADQAAAANDPAAPQPPPVTITPQEIAYIASARLRLTPPNPMVGPSPDINRWKMAAVGYPLWLWADGDLDPAPVSDSVYDVSVSLDARLRKVVFEMGDGNAVTCTDLSRQWDRSVAPGAKSPTCGYTYTTPSLPHGDYTITARTFWAIDWNINGTTGTLPFVQEATSTLPVGELQVLVR